MSITIELLEKKIVELETEITRLKTAHAEEVACLQAEIEHLKAKISTPVRKDPDWPESV